MEGKAVKMRLFPISSFQSVPGHLYASIQSAFSQIDNRRLCIVI
jgi:hypothetical protein